MSNELKIFINFLKKKKLKFTGQRKQILDVFLKTEKHLSAEDLYEIVRKRNPGIGHATVFRTLNILCEAGIANKVDLGDGKRRYEHRHDHRHHDHLVCVKCGSFIEAVDPKIEKLQEELCRKHGFLPQRHKMDIFGVCKKCRKK